MYPGAGLASALRQDTKPLHAQAERSGVMRDLLQGRLGLVEYCRLLRNLRALYAVLEPALLRHCDHPCVAPVYFPALFREAALTADLKSLGDADAANDEAALAAATLIYRQRLQELDAHDPALLVAHAYARYLGDLSGGQILARIVARSYGLVGDAGTRFYDFGPADTVLAQAKALRLGLDAVPVDAADGRRIVGEAQHAFSLHGQLFEQLAAA